MSPLFPANTKKMAVSKPSVSPSEGVDAQQDDIDPVLSPQPAQAQTQHTQLQKQHRQLQEAKLLSCNLGQAAAQDQQQANGYVSPESTPHAHDSMDEDDAVLLADMQGFASALGCDWQVLASKGCSYIYCNLCACPTSHSLVQLCLLCRARGKTHCSHAFPDTATVLIFPCTLGDASEPSSVELG